MKENRVSRNTQWIWNVKVVVTWRGRGLCLARKMGQGWCATWVVVTWVFILFFCLFRTLPRAYGSFQARGQIGAVAVSLSQPEQHQIWAAPATYTTAHGKAGFLIHRARPGIQSVSSWMLVKFVSAEPQQELCPFSNQFLFLFCYWVVWVFYILWFQV